MAQTLRGRAAYLSASAVFWVGAIVALSLVKPHLIAPPAIEPPAVTINVEPQPKPDPAPPKVEKQQKMINPDDVFVRPTPVDVFPMAPEEAVLPTVTGAESGTGDPLMITDPKWIRRPSGAEFARYYPNRALERGMGGLVRLDCIVNAQGGINCSVASETPEKWGFGAAAVKISKYFQMSPKLENGRPVEGGRVSVTIAFRAE